MRSTSNCLFAFHELKPSSDLTDYHALRWLEPCDRLRIVRCPEAIEEELPMKSAIRESGKSLAREVGAAHGRVAERESLPARAGVELVYAVGRCSLGAIVVAASEKGVRAILLGDQSATLVQDLKK